MNGPVDLSVQHSSNRLSRVTQTGVARDQPLGLILREAGLLNDEEIDCSRRLKTEPPCRLKFEPGAEADFEMVGCG